MAEPRRVELKWNQEQLDLLIDALGPAVMEIIDHQLDVTDIFIRPRWSGIERLATGLEDVPRLLPQEKLTSVLAILSTALSKEMSLADPEVQITFRLREDGPRVRFTGLYAGPGGLDSILTMRVARSREVSLQHLIDTAVIPLEVSRRLTAQLSSPRPPGILVGGPVGTGKTHLLRGLIRHVLDSPIKQHIVISEDELELDFDDPFVTNIETTRYFDNDAALRSTKRHRPTLLVVGEVLGPEARPAIKAGAAGAGLMMTCHGVTAAACIRTLQAYQSEGTSVPQNPGLISDALQIALIMARVNGRFFVREAVEILEVTHDNAKLSSFYKAT